MAKTARPEELPIVGKVGMMGLVAAAYRQRANYLAVLFGFRIDVDGDEFVLLVADALSAQGPDIDVVFLAGDLLHIWGIAGLVGIDAAGHRCTCQAGNGEAA